jgi:pimeloyl-[acyl-carrier protein] methyl ester esterase
LKKDFAKACEGFFRGMFTGAELSSAGYELIEAEYFHSTRRPPCHAALQALDTLAAADVRGSLATVDVPVLLAHGAGDAICPADASRWMAKALPDASLAILEGAGHAPMLTRASELNGILDDFLERVYEGDR